MTPEEYQRIKEAEKEHLRTLKALKQTARILERQQAINRALQDMTGSAADALDTHAEMVDQLAMETAMNEARLEVALDAARAQEAARPPEELEAELQLTQARQMIDQLKRQMDAPEPARPDPQGSATPVQKMPGKNQTPGAEGKSPADLPEKTIGRMR